MNQVIDFDNVYVMEVMSVGEGLYFWSLIRDESSTLILNHSHTLVL